MNSFMHMNRYMRRENVESSPKMKDFKDSETNIDMNIIVRQSRVYSNTLLRNTPIENVEVVKSEW